MSREVDVGHLARQAQYSHELQQPYESHRPAMSRVRRENVRTITQQRLCEHVRSFVRYEPPKQRAELTWGR